MTCTGNCSYCKDAVFCRHPGKPKTTTDSNRKNMRRSVVAVILSLALLAVVLERPSQASFDGGQSLINRRSAVMPQKERQRDVERIIQVFESKVEGGKMPARAVSKLSSMDDDGLRLMTSLCDHVADARNNDGAVFVLLLVSAWIVVT